MKRESQPKTIASSSPLLFLPSFSLSLNIMSTPEEVTTEAAAAKIVLRRHDIQWEHLDKPKFYLTGMTMFLGVRALVYPSLVVKTRIMITKQGSLYKSTSSAYGTIIRTEGFRGEATTESFYSDR